jgi:hypothetical protein
VGLGPNEPVQVLNAGARTGLGVWTPDRPPETRDQQTNRLNAHYAVRGMRLQLAEGVSIHSAPTEHLISVRWCQGGGGVLENACWECIGIASWLTGGLWSARSPARSSLPGARGGDRRVARSGAHERGHRARRTIPTVVVTLKAGYGENCPQPRVEFHPASPSRPLVSR